jgi:hypothetical protein
VQENKNIMTIALLIALPMLIGISAFGLNALLPKEHDDTPYRLAQAVEGLEVLQKAARVYAHRIGGAFPVAPADLKTLESKSLLETEDNGSWAMAPGFEVVNLALSYADGQNKMVMTVTFANPLLGQGLYRAMALKPGFISGPECGPPSATTTSTKICFSDSI